MPTGRYGDILEGVGRQAASDFLPLAGLPVKNKDWLADPYGLKEPMTGPFAPKGQDFLETAMQDIANPPISRWRASQKLETPKVGGIPVTPTPTDTLNADVSAYSPKVFGEGVPSPSRGEGMYQYKQPNGTLAFTDRLETIPPELRASAERRNWSDVATSGKGSLTVLPEAGGPFGGIPQTDAQLELSARKAGTYQGPTLADKEKSIMGGIEHPGDFDYNRFKEGINQLGIKITPQTMIQLYGTALKEHENKVTQYNDLLKARMQFGEGSPQMISAKSTAQYHDISSRIAGAKAGPEMAQVLASIDKTRAETAGIPATTEHQKALTGYYQAMTENPEMKTNIAQLNAGMKMVSEELDPTKRMDLYNKVMGAFEANKARVYGRYEGIYGNLRKQYKMLPEKMTPGDYDLGDGHKIRITPDLTVEQI